MGNMLIIVFSHYVPILLYAGYNGKIKKTAMSTFIRN